MLKEANFLKYFSILAVSFILSFSVTPIKAEQETQNNEVSQNERADVLKSFTGTQRGGLIASYDEQRNQHVILFYMGVALLLFVFLTAGYGIAMAMLGKEVFVQHMICAGITVFLSIAHAVVAVVWFFPF